MSSFERLKTTGELDNGFVPSPLGCSGSHRGAIEFVAAGAEGAVEEDDEASQPTEEEIRAEAYADGFEAGTSQLPWQETEEVRGLLETLEQAVGDVAKLRRDYLMNERTAVVDLAVAIAEKLVRRTVEADREVLEGIIERSAQALPNDPKLRVALSPADFDSLQTGMSEALASICSSTGAAIEADAELQRGDVVVSGADASVDGRVDSLLGHVKASLADLYDAKEVQA